MIRPPFLKKGDKIAITSTARKLSYSEINSGIKALEGFGYEVVVSPTIGAEHHIFAGDDAMRAEELQGFINDETIKAIWLARGGYGSIRILQQINWSTFKASPKWLIGFSDVTNLLTYSTLQGAAGIHGPMPKTVPSNFEDDESVQRLFSMLAGEKSPLEWQSTQHCRKGTAEGKLLGGNLASLFALVPGLPEDYFDDAILFLEDIDEYLYEIDRMLRGLELSGRLNKLKALVIGQFTCMKDNDDPFGENLQEIVRSVFAAHDFPIAFGLQAGHEEVNWPLMLGAYYRLEEKGWGWKLLMD